MVKDEAKSPIKLKKKLTNSHLTSGGISEWPKERTERSIANIVILPDATDKETATYHIEEK